MAKKSQIYEVDLFELMKVVWDGKWKIAVAVVISLVSLISYQSTEKNNFKAITNITPLSILDIDKYIYFNNAINTINNSNPDVNINDVNINDVNINDDVNVPGKLLSITVSRLLNLYLEVLNDKSVFIDSIRKFQLLEASQYNNDKEYNEAIIRLVSSIRILTPLINKKGDGNLEIYYHTIHFTHHDEKKWKNVLMDVDKKVNKMVREILIKEYNNNLSFLKRKKKYQLQDISIKINNYLIDYEREISDRLAYLEEQSAIAKKLGIKKNTIEVQTFGNQNALLSNVKTDSPFYLRGYEAIDKEIELIQVRVNKKAFIIGLFDLEKKKRDIEQNKTVERIILSLQSELLSDNENFAASINAITTKFEYKEKSSSITLAILIGLIVGIFYVIISNSYQSNRVSRKKTN